LSDLPFVETAGEDARPLWPVGKQDLEAWRAGLADPARRWLEATGFKAEAGDLAAVPDAGGGVAGWAVGQGETADFWTWGGLPAKLPGGLYRIDAAQDREQATGAALAWSLGTYAFDRYRRKPSPQRASLLLPEAADRREAAALACGIVRARDLINLPAGDLGPAELADAATALAGEIGATCRVIAGDRLLAENYPAVHAVGRAAANAPRLIDLVWGDAAAPRVTLVGKGVCFDTGGLDLKPSAGMRRMKKDMGGAATVLGLAEAIARRGLPIRLRVLVPAVENAVAGNAYRPGDILQTRKGLTVEVGNTDAEGRIILADALAEADTERPDLLVDVATLTGAARVALGPDLPALFTPDDRLAADLLEAGTATGDPFWRMPLHPRYRDWLKSKVADLSNVSEGAFAGAVTAALFLKEFVADTAAWAHIDSYAWNDEARPGRPAGGEPLGLRALYLAIERRFAAGA